MAKEQVGLRGEQEAPKVFSGRGFDLEFRQGMALLTMSDFWVADLLFVRRLELELPGVSFPFDLQGGASQFQHRRCQLRSLVFELKADRLAHWLSGSLDEVGSGIKDARLDFNEGRGLLSGIFSQGEREAPFTARFALGPFDDLLVRLGFYDVRFYRWMPSPPVALVAQLGRACGAWAKSKDAAWLEFSPINDLLRHLLPMHGWKLPDMEGVRFMPPEMEGGRVLLAAGKRPEELGEWLHGLSPQPGRAFLVFREGAANYREAEQALRAGHFDRAQALYLGKADVEPAHPLALRRMLEIGLTNPSRYSMLEDRIRDVLARNDQDIAAMLVRALLQEQRQDLAAGASFQRVALRADENDEKIDAIFAYRRAGDLLAQHDLAAAIPCLERVCQLAPDDRDALRDLAELYEKAHRFYPALRSWLRLAHRLEDDAAIAACHARMARIHLDRFEDQEKARKHLDASLTRDPDCLDALVLQAKVQGMRNRPARAAESLARALEVLEQTPSEEDIGRVVALRTELARLWEEELDDPAMALLHNERILEEQPEHLLALSKVGHLALVLRRPDQAAEAFTRVLDLEATGIALPDDVLHTACLQLGQLYVNRPGGEGEARKFLSRVVEMDPENPDAWSALERIDRRLGDTAHLVHVLENRSVLTADADARLGMLLEAGRLARETLEDPKRAERFFGQALKVDPTSQEGLAALEDLLRQAGRWAEIEQLWVGAIDESMEVEEAARHWAKVGRLRLDSLSDLEGGLQALELACRLAPKEAEYGERLLALYREHDRMESYVQLVPRMTGTGMDVSRQVELWLERARLQSEQLDRPEEAIESYQRALELDDSLLVARRALADLYVEQERWAEAKEAIGRVIDGAGEGGLSGPGLVTLHKRWAQAEIALDNPEGAAEQLRMVLAIDQADEDSALELSNLLRDQERWEELAALYAQRAELATFEDAARLHTAAASIWWEKLKQLEPAASQYKAAIEAAPDSDAAPARLASLHRVFAGLGDWSEVEKVLSQRIANSQGAEVPGLRMARAAILKGRLQREDEAAACLVQALEADPEHLDALVALAKHHEEAGDFAKALDFAQRALAVDQLNRTRAGEIEDLWDEDAWEKAAAGEQEGPSAKPVLPVERRADLALESARAAWTLERWDEAIELYQVHMESYVNRGYADVEPEAIERLEMLLRKQRRYEDLALLLQRWLKSELLPERHAGLQRVLALLMFEHLDEPDEAIILLGDHVRELPEDQAAVRDLIEMLGKSKRHEQLAHLLEDQWDMALEPEERILRLKLLSEIFRTQIHDNQAAIEYYGKLRESGQPEATDQLIELYEEEERHEELAVLLREEAERSEDDQRAGSLWRQLGLLARDELKDKKRCLDALERAYLSVPSPQHLDLVLDALRQDGPVERLENMLVQAAAEAEEPEERRRFLVEHADLCLNRLELTSDGLASLREALLIEADEALVRRAQALYERLQDWAGVADMQEMLVDLAEDDAAAARRVHRLGIMFAERLDAPERALAAFSRAAELDADWLEPDREEARLLEAMARWEELVEVQVRIAERTERTQERAKLYQQAAHLCLAEVDDQARGFDLLRLAAEATPEQAVIWFELSDLLEADDKLGEAADVLERVAASEPEHMEGLGSQAALYRRMASLREREGDEVGAIASYERTLMIEPSDEHSAQRLEGLYREMGRYEDLAQMLGGLARRTTGETAAQHWVAVARAWQEAEDDEQAEVAVLQALTASSGHVEARLLLVDLLASRGAWSRFLDVVDMLPDALLQTEDLTSQVLTCWEELGDAEGNKLPVALTMLRLDPTHLDALRVAAQDLESAGLAEEAEIHWRKLDEQADRLEPEERYTLDLRLANLDFARGRTDEAEQRLKRCVETRPDDPGPRAFLHKIYSGGRRFEDRVQLLLDESERAESDAQRFEKVRAAAQLMELELGNPKAAATLFEELVLREPGRLEAWRKLAELRRLTNEPAGQVVALMHLAELASGEEQDRAQRRAARLCSDSLGDDLRARELWKRVLESVPGDEEALDRLIDMDRNADEPLSLKKHLEMRLGGLEDPVERADVLRELADLFVDRLDEPGEAIPVLEELKTLVPSDQVALERLEPLLREAGRIEDAVDVLARQVDLAGSELQRAPLVLRMAELQLDGLGDRVASVQSLKRAAQLAPNDLEPWKRLRAIAESSGDDELLAETIDALAGRSQHPDDELKLRRALGLLRWSLGHEELAREAFERLLVLRPDDAVGHRFLARMLTDVDPAAARLHLRWLLDHEEVLSVADTLTCLRSYLAVTEEAGPEARIQVLKHLLELEPGDVEAAEELLGLFRQTERKRELADLLVRPVDLGREVPAGDWVERAGLLEQFGDDSAAAESLAHALDVPGAHRYEVAVHLAEIRREKLSDSRGALECLEVALDETGDDAVLLHAMANLAEELERFEQAVVYLDRLRDVVELKKRAGLSLRLGKALVRNGQTLEARKALEEAIVGDPGLRAAHEELFSLMVDDDSSEIEEQAQVLVRWAESPAAGNRKAELLSRAGALYQEAGADEKSLDARLASAEADPGQLEVHRGLLPLLREKGDDHLLSLSCGYVVELSQDDDERLACAYEQALLAGGVLGQPELAESRLRLCL
ncbi:MAG: tetratricopeptide repeat protein, partial [Deltaproteobacteria bacterium]|nr:tetratricopeptide repeat protein [Deltaproteobacteria bacterium]